MTALAWADIIFGTIVTIFILIMIYETIRKKRGERQ